MTLLASLVRIAAFAILMTSIQSCASAPYRAIELDELRDAEGWYEFPGFRFRGEMNAGQPNGPGVVLYPNGVRVESTFRNGAATGTARVNVPDFGMFTGEMEAGRLASGELVKEDGDYYRGRFVNWRPEGAGLLVRANNERYTGPFRQGVPHGNGVSFDPATRTMIEGNFVNGKPEGTALVLREGKPSMREFRLGVDVTEEETKELAPAAIAEREAGAQAAAETRKSACAYSQSCYCVISADGIRESRCTF